MKLLYLAFPLILFYLTACNSNQNDNPQSNTEEEESGEITEESMDYFAENMNDDPGYVNGPITTRSEMGSVLEDIGVAVFCEDPTTDGPAYKAVEIIDEEYKKPCKYDELGTLSFHIGTERGSGEEFNGYPLPVIEHNLFEPNFFYIEDLSVLDEGNEFSLKIKPFQFNNDGYFIDEAIPHEYWSLIKSSEHGYILETGERDGMVYGNFMDAEERSEIPSAICNQNYYQ